MLTFPPDVDDYPTPHFGSDPPCWSKNDSLIDVQNSSIYYRSSPSLLPYSSNFAIDNNNAYTDSYGPSPPGTAISTSSNSADASSTDARSPTNNSKTYSFVALPGNAVKKRPRRRYDEIERLYQCSWPDCTKAYGTLNHLNAHVTMQKHGQKRSPNEFKEIRKQWRKQKKEQEAVIAAGQANLSRRTSMSSLHSEDDLYQSMVASYLDDDLSDVDYRHSQWGYSSTRSSLGNDYISSLPSQPTQPTYHHLPPHHHHHYRQSLSESSSSFSSYSSPSSSYSSYSQYDRLPQNSPLFTPLPGFGTDSGSASREQAPSLSSPPSLPPLPSISSLPPLQTQPTSQMGYGMDTIALEDSCSSQPSHPRSLLSPLPAELQNKYQLFEYDDQPPPPYALQPPAETAQTGSERGHGNAHHTRIRHSGDGAGGAGGGNHGQNEPGHSTRKFGHSRSRAGSFGSSASDSSFSRHDHELHDQDPGPGFVVPTLALDTSVSSDHVMAEPSISIGITPMPPALQMTPPSPNPSIVSRSSVYCDSIQDRHPNVPTISVSNYDGLTNFELESTGCPGSATLDVAALDVEVDVEMVVDELEEKEQDTGGRLCTDFGWNSSDMEVLSFPRSPAVFRGPKSERYFFSSPSGGDAPKPAIDSWVSDHVLSPELLTDVSTKLPFKSKLISMDNLGFGSWSSSDYVMGFMKVDREAIRHAFALLKPILSIGSAKESWAPTSILLIWDGITPKESQTSVQSHAFFHLPDTGFNMKALYSVLRNSLPAKVSSITPSSRPLCRPQLEASEGCYTRKYWAPHIGICAIDPRRLAVRSSHHGTGDNAVILSPRKWLSGSRCGVNSNEELIRQVWDLDELITPIVLPKPTPSTNDCIPVPCRQEWNWPESSPLISSFQPVSSPPQSVLCSSSPGQQSGCNSLAVTNAPDPPKLYERLVIRPYPRYKRLKQISHGLRAGWFQSHRPNRSQSTQSQKLDSSLLCYIADLLLSCQSAFEGARDIHFNEGSTSVSCQQYIQYGQSYVGNLSNPLGDSQGLDFKTQQLERENRELRREREALYTALREFQALRVDENSQQTSWHYTPRRPVEPEPPPILANYASNRSAQASTRPRCHAQPRNNESYDHNSRPHQTMPNDSPLTDTLRQTHATALVDLLLNQLLERELGRLRQTHATLDIEGDSSATLRPAPHEQETVDRQLPHGPHLPASTQGPNSHSSHYVEEYRYDSDNNVGEDSIPRPASVLAAGSVVSSSPLSQQAVPGSDDSNLRVLVQNLQQEVQGLRSVQVLVPNLQQEVQELRSLIQDSDFERAHGYQSSLYEDDDTDSGLFPRVWMMRQLLKVILLKLFYVLLPGVVFLYIYGSQE